MSSPDSGLDGYDVWWLADMHGGSGGSGLPAWRRCPFVTLAVDTQSSTVIVAVVVDRKGLRLIDAATWCSLLRV